MPKPHEILNGLQTIVSNFSWYAILWHFVFYLLVIALMVKWTPSNRFMGIFLSLPLLSVAIFAWITGNPFNGMLFTIAFASILILGIRCTGTPITTSSFVYLIAGIIMVIFGLVYPHFLDTGSIAKYLYASPAGLIPCPTLSVLIGLLLIFNGLGSTYLTLSFIVLGLFYGLFGVFRLGVHLDLFLLGGTISLIVKYISMLK